MRKATALPRVLIKRASWIVAVKVVLSLVVLAFAVSISVTTTNFQAEIGSVVKVANGLLATDKGFSLASSASLPSGTSCLAPITFGTSPGTANTLTTGGHLVYDVQVNSTMAAPANSKFNVTLVMGGTTYGPLCIQTPATPANGQTIDCKFDVGTSLPASPYTFKVTVQ